MAVQFLPVVKNARLKSLEDEAIFIIRELIAASPKPALLFSGGKDSMVLLHLAVKAFSIAGKNLSTPFQAVHIDTGHNYDEVIAFRDQVVQAYQVPLIIGKVEDSIKTGAVTLASAHASRNAAQSVTLLEQIQQHGWSALMGGARRDEEPARAKERIFSLRDEFGGWNPKDQRPELWSLYNTELKPLEHLRVFPISNFTEQDVWEYILAEQLPLPDIYFAHEREVVVRGEVLIPVNDLMPMHANEVSKKLMVRFRTVGDRSVTCPVASDASMAKTNKRAIEHIIADTLKTPISERAATRMDDKVTAGAMEKRKKEGYF